LTRRIRDRCSDSLAYKPIFQSLSRVYGDELDVMGLRHGELAMVREVYSVLWQHAGGVCALRCCAQESAGCMARVKRIWGINRLGTVLFTNPKIRRTPLEFKKVSRGHFLYERACTRMHH
jgi:chorismate--pyruvate lyase